LVVVGSDEQLTVRFRYATPSAPNPVFPGFSRYQNVNKEIIYSLIMLKKLGNTPFPGFFYTQNSAWTVRF
jgi:hypothetical protein